MPLHQRDIETQDAMLQVIARRLVEAGFNVDDQVMEDSRERWLDSTDVVEQKQLAGRLQETALSDVLFCRWDAII